MRLRAYLLEEFDDVIEQYQDDVENLVECEGFMYTLCVYNIIRMHMQL